MKKYLPYAIAALVVGTIFFRISQMPSGVISHGQPADFNNTATSAYDTGPMPGTPAYEKAHGGKGATSTGNTVEATTPAQTDSGQVVINGSARVTATDPNTGKPLEIIIKDERHSHSHGDDAANSLDNDPRSLKSFFMTAEAVVGYIAKMAIYTIIISFVFMMLMGWRPFSRFGMGGTRMPANQGGFGGTAQETAEKVFGQWIKADDIKIRGFEDVAGIPEAISQMKKVKLEVVQQAEAVKKIRAEEEAKLSKEKGDGKSVVKMTAAALMDKLQSITKRSRFGGKLPQCVLFEGIPGTGKTLLVTALAKECGVDVFVISGSDFVEMFVGLGANRVREMFSDAREKRPCLIFIDELDAVGRARTSGPGSHPEADQTLNQILVELQGLNTGNQNFGLWIFGATNRKDILDKALLRPGRFTWVIKVDPPHLEGRVEILKVHTNKREVPLADDVDFDAIASVLAGLTGADLENVVNETALYAEELAKAEAEKLRKKGGLTEEEIEARIKSSVTQEDFFEGLLRHLMGLKKDIPLTFDEIFNTVVHEGGHALGVAYEGFLGRTNEIVRFIAVEPRGSSGGLTFKTPERDKFTHTLDDVDANAVCGFGGSAAQLVWLNVKDSGPDNDFEVVASQIYRAIARWYASDKIGPISLGQRGMTNYTEMGSGQKDMIDAEVHLKTKVLYARTWWIMNLFVRSEAIWTMFWELLDRKIMRQTRFYELFNEAMKEVEAHPNWANGNLDSLLERVEKAPYDWKPEPLDAATREFIKGRVEQLRARYEALNEAEEAAV